MNPNRSAPPAAPNARPVRGLAVRDPQHDAGDRALVRVHRLAVLPLTRLPYGKSLPRGKYDTVSFRYTCLSMEVHPMFLCLTLTIAPIGLAIVAFLLTTIGAFLEVF